jgi:rhamnose transport system permease protein
VTTATTSPATTTTPISGGAVTCAIPPQQIVLLAILLVELVIFGITGTNFLTGANAFQLPRMFVELGLLALALTPVILAGGIDLSVGALMGLCAVLFGKLWRDAGLPPWMAALLTLAFGAAAGALNGRLITRLRIPPLIVTLGTLSLFRGVAEGITGGKDTFTDFPTTFTSLGQGDFLGLPAQLLVFIPIAIAFHLLVHRMTVGRALSAIGYSPEGARHAGLRVDRLVAGTYVLSGLCAALAALIYVPRFGQAKADAGTGYELLAITAVVLGGTSIFGGRGSIPGTLLGILVLAILENGLRLAAGPAELAGFLTGLLLLVAIGLDWRAGGSTGRAVAGGTATAPASTSEAFDMKNSQLAVLSAVILAAALIVAFSNVWLVRALHQRDPIVAGNTGAGQTPSSSKKLTIAMMPKSKGNAYFIACRKGAEEAAQELGVELLWDGPTTTDPAKQNEIVDTWVTRGVDVIAVAVENREGLSTSLRRAQEKGIKVVTWDADAAPDARSFFVNQATPQGIGHTLMDTAAQVMGGEGKFAIITGSLTAANLNEWRKHIEQRLAEKYPTIQLTETVPCDDKQNEAFEQAKLLLNKYSDLELIMAVCSPAVPGAAEAVEQSGRNNVKVIGLGLPNDNKRYVHNGTTEAVILWNTMDLGYLTIRAAHDLAMGTLKPGAETFAAGRLGKVTIAGDNILLGQPFTFTKQNIDQFDF